MKKLLLVLLIILTFAGCEPYQVENNTVFNLDPVKQNITLSVSRTDEYIQFQVKNHENILEADECILRNDNTHELYANFGDYQNIVYILNQDGYYSLGFYKNDIEVIYNFKLSELDQSQIINY